MPHFSCSHISIIRDAQPIVGDATFSCPPGSLTVITGANGSGKSTLLQGIMGLLEPEAVQGIIQLDTHNITELSLPDRARAGIFLIHQNPVVLPGISFATLMQEMFRVHGMHTNATQRAERIAAVLEMVGLPVCYADRAVHEGFSGGEKKRLELAQLLLMQPCVALIDELDSGLDAAGCAMAIDCLAQLRRAQPEMVCVVVTHSQAFAQSLKPDQWLVMEQGILRQQLVPSP